MLICTSVCSNYLPKAAVLARSVRRHNPEARFVVCLTEREVPAIARGCAYFHDVVLASELGFADFERYIFKHRVVEACTAVKGQLFRYLLNNFPDEREFVYLDPDIKVYGPLTELREALQEHPVVLTPHLCDPESTLDAVLDNELCALKHGVYNLGFLAVARHPEGERFVDWWTTRLDMFCYDDIPNGIFTDQRWIDLAVGFFDAHVLKHRGYNVAPWNLSQRKITLSDDGGYLVNGQALRFFHFSGFDSGANEAMIQKYVPDLHDPVYRLRDDYVAELESFGQDRLGTLPWTYANFSNGEPILDRSRVKFRTDPGMVQRIPKPFLMSNAAFV